MVNFSQGFLAILAWLLLGGPLACMLRAVEPPPSVSPSVERVLKWLPEDLDTIVAAQSLEIKEPAKRELDDPQGHDLKPIIQSLAWEEPLGLGDPKYLKPFFGKKVKLALSGGRGFETVSNFGSLRSESCSIILFEQELGEAASEWIKLVREGAKEVRRIAGHEVFVFPSPVAMEGWIKPEPWQGAYFLLLRPNILLGATSDRFLEEVLKRIEGAPVRRALADNLPEWRHVDPTADAWILRRIPQSHSDRLISGVTWTWKDDRLRVVYLPRKKNAERVEVAVRARWSPPKLPGSDELLLDARPTSVERGNDGATVVTFRTNGVGWEPAFWFCLQCYVLRGEDGRIGRS